jgi:hypothetical protein
LTELEDSLVFFFLTKLIELLKIEYSPLFLTFLKTDTMQKSIIHVLFIWYLMGQTLSAQAIFNLYSQTTSSGTAVAAFNNNANYLISTCSGDQAQYLWTDADGNLLNTETDFAGSCGQYRIDATTYIKVDAVGNAPDRDIRFQKTNRGGTVTLTKTYSLDRDNFGQFVIPTSDGGFLITGATQVADDTLYKVQLIKTNADGDMQWQKVITQGLFYSRVRRPNPTGCYDIMNGTSITITNAGQMSDGGYFLQYLLDDPSFDCAFGGGDGGVIIRLDANGNFLWEIHDQGGPMAAIRYKVAPSENGSLIALKSAASGDSRSCRFEGYQLIKYNSAGTPSWTFTRSGATCLPQGSQYANAFDIYPNGDIVLEGQQLTVFRKINGQTGVLMDSLVVPPNPQVRFANAITAQADGTFAVTGGGDGSSAFRAFFYKNKFNTTPSGRAPLRIISISAPTASVQGGAATCQVTFQNIGTVPSAASRRAGIFETFQYQGEPWAYRWFDVRSGSNLVPIGQSIAPGETVTIPMTFQLNNTVTLKGELPTVAGIQKNCLIAFENMTLGAQERTSIYDTLYNFVYLDRIDLPDGDLSAEIITPDTTFGGDAIIRYTVRVRNAGSQTARSVQAVVFVFSPYGGEVVDTVVLSKGSYEKVCPYPFGCARTNGNWTIGDMTAGETVTCTVFLKNQNFLYYGLQTVMTAFAQSAQLDDINTDNNAQNQIFTFNLSKPRAILSLENLVVTPAGIPQNDSVTISYNIRNTGNLVARDIAHKAFVRDNPHDNNGGYDFGDNPAKVTIAANSMVQISRKVSLSGIPIGSYFMQIQGYFGNLSADLTIQNPTIATPLRINDVSLNAASTPSESVFIQSVTPTITEGKILVQIESLIKEDICINFYDLTGKILKTEKRGIQKGINQLQFDVFDLPRGLYCIQISAGAERSKAIKFVKQ